MSESYKVIEFRVVPSSEDEVGRWMEEGMDALDDLCRCRRHWWQFWREKYCSFDVISSRVVTETYDDDDLL